MKKYKEDHGTPKYFWCEANAGQRSDGSTSPGEEEHGDAAGTGTGTEMSHFDIAGANGEAVTEVHWNAVLGALKLVTNHGQKCNWGGSSEVSSNSELDISSSSSSNDEWSIKRSDPGEIIVGLRCCYGRLGGWDEAVGTYRHWKLTDVGVVVAKLEEASLEEREVRYRDLDICFSWR